MSNAQGMADKLYSAFSQLPPELKAQVADIAMKGAGSRMTPENRSRAMDLLASNGKYAEMQMQRAGVKMPSSYEPEMGSAHNFNVIEGVDKLMRDSERSAPAPASAKAAPAASAKAPVVGKRPGDKSKVAGGEVQTVEYAPPTRRSEANTRTAENDPLSRVAREEMNPNEKERDKDMDDTSLAGKVAGAAAAGAAAYIAYRAYKNRTQAVIVDESGKVLGEASPADIKALPKYEEAQTPRNKAPSTDMTVRPAPMEGEEMLNRMMQGPVIDGEHTEIPPQRALPPPSDAPMPDGGDRIPEMANPTNDRQIADTNPDRAMVRKAQQGMNGIDDVINMSMEEANGPKSSGLNKGRPKMNARTPNPRIKFR